MNSMVTAPAPAAAFVPSKKLVRDPTYEGSLIRLLVGVTVIFFVIPIYFAAFGVLGYESYGVTYRSGFKGLMYAQGQWRNLLHVEGFDVEVEVSDDLSLPPVVVVREEA